jgi:HD-GYP domain-containing protein (c-di-GMP phosphodiesterase class II)
MQTANIQRKVRNLIFLTCIGVAAVISPLSFWAISTEATKSAVYIAKTEVKRVHKLLVNSHLSPSTEDKKSLAKYATNGLLGGLFDYVDYYDATGIELSESKTEIGKKFYVESSHKFKQSTETTTALQKPVGNQRFLTITIPINIIYEDSNSELMGFLELGRSIPDWRNEQVTRIALFMSAIAAISAFLCGLLIYPKVKDLIVIARNRKEQITEAHLNLIDAMGRAVAKKESSTGTHNYRVTYIAIRLGEAIGLSEIQIQDLIAGSFLHDVGKIAIPDSILLKPGKLDEAEWKIMKAHVEHGEEIVKGIGWLGPESQSVISGHHERWDGTGYPRKTAGATIPLLARIFTVADVFDAMASKRSYKEPMALSQIIEYLHEQSGKQFDPEIVSACEAIAVETFNTIADIDEDSAKSLLAPLLSKYFQIGHEYLLP